MFGAPGWTSVLGDWNGDGKTEIGIYKDGTWYLDYNGNGIWDAGIDKLDYFGTLGWTPVVGNWNGDATGDKIGIYKDGTWYLDNDGSGTWNAGDRANVFGAPAGHQYSATGMEIDRTEIGIYKDGTWYLDYNGNGIWDAGIDKLDYFGTLGWTRLSGNGVERQLFIQSFLIIIQFHPVHQYSFFLISQNLKSWKLTGACRKTIFGN